MPQVKVRKGADPSFQYYYKCRTKGCCFNKNVKDIHGKFEAMLADITIKPELIDPLLFQLEKTFDVFKLLFNVSRGILIEPLMCPL